MLMLFRITVIVEMDPFPPHQAESNIEAQTQGRSHTAYTLWWYILVEICTRMQTEVKTKTSGYPCSAGPCSSNLDRGRFHKAA